MQFFTLALLGSILNLLNISASTPANYYASSNLVLNGSQADRDNKLVEAFNNFELMDALLASGANVNHALGSAQYTALQRASCYGLTKSVKLLLNQKGINVNATGSCGRTALILACIYGFTEIAALLLMHEDVNVNLADNFGLTALAFACSHGYTEIVDLLLSKEDLDVNARTSSLNETPLMLALNHGHPTIAENILIKKRKRIDFEIENVLGETVLIIAAKRGHDRIVSILLAEETVNVNHTDKQGKTALIHACFYGHKQSVLALLSGGKCDVHHRDNLGNEALNYSGSKPEITEMITECSWISESKPDIRVVIEDEPVKETKRALKDEPSRETKKSRRV